MRGMKLLTDFDGVWTWPEWEGRAQGQVLDELFAEWTPQPERAAVAAWIHAAREQCAREPQRYGWAPGGGRLSAFGDEDPFAPHSALLHYIHLHADRDPVATALAERARSHGYEDLDALGGFAHATAVARVRDERGPGLLPEAAAAGHRLLEAGVEVVVVSNSGAAKLGEWFGHAGLPFTNAQRDGRSIALRGGARKFLLDDSRSDPLRWNGLEIETARPYYEEALRDERPGAVVGDVFSLDLALPLRLKLREPEWSQLALYWLIHPYTPRWLEEQVTKHAGDAVIPIRGGFAALGDLLVANA
jgi:hypothetical protein